MTMGYLPLLTNGRKGCCADPCTSIRVSCEVENSCCKKIPKTFCIKFIPDNLDDYAETSLLVDFGYYDALIGRYTITKVNGCTFRITYEQTIYGECFWRLQVHVWATEVYIGVEIFNQTYPISNNLLTCDDGYGYGYGYGGNKPCENPSFTFSTDHEGATTPGNFIIQRFDLSHAKFRRIAFSPEESEVELYEPVCGGCVKPCRYICVEYDKVIVNEDDEEILTHIKRTFIWMANHEHQAGWYSTKCDVEDSIIPLENAYEYGGGCRLAISIADLPGADFPDTRMNNSPCGIGMDVSFASVLHGTVKICCGPCSYWKTLCGSCRCACKTLCVAYDFATGPDSTTYTELNWDDENSRWGDDTFNITLEDNGCGGCQSRVTGFEEVFQITECGRGFFLFRDIDEIGVFVSAACKMCSCGGPNGCCGSAPLPYFLFADVTRDDLYTYMGGPIWPCLPMPGILNIHLVWVPLGVEERSRWEGSKDFVDNCGHTHTCTVRVSCNVSDAPGEFWAKVTLSNAIVGIFGEWEFPAIGTESCSPLVIGNSEWDNVIGTLATGPAIPTGPGDACLECPQGLNLRVVE